LAQFAVTLQYPTTAEEIERQVRDLEITHFPSVIESVLLDGIL
jgi:hypothetical protein